MTATATANDTRSDPRWERVLARDPNADGIFWYSVATTGVYCRPSCPSRAANPGNVALHDTLAEAQATGFRACKRCRPDDPSSATTATIAAACRLIEAREDIPSLTEMATIVGLSPTYFHRLFRRTTGLTPKGYAAARRAERVRGALAKDGSITGAIYDAGYNSSGRFYAQAAGTLGMTPTRYKAGGTDEVLRFAIGQSSLGAILVASSETGVAAILIGDDPGVLAEDLQDRFPRATLVGDDAAYEQLVARVVGLVEAPGLAIDLPLDIRGTAFQQRVWQALRDIPAGRTMTYAELAVHIGSPASVRAVAGACAANTIAVAIPCHRVVRTDGTLSGYAWGVERKRTLIAREATLA
ncbi:bifunctional DNA-binding transcriptional regulator/O6-methylguanine-DNA methyltransferase Ada [uncultured Sphingomonas sp.]|uniref:bifunctional DNA-binding transcriptional regulator/O6-methylguanine-DNA methyltransferase Ada n=1 Tax=uncultured Sphingomonas sp. TaxID=158754 RepID=UPI0035CA9C37